jgi:hypothetical protein
MYSKWDKKKRLPRVWICVFFFFTHEYVTYSVLTSTDVPFSNGNEEKINEIKIELRNEAVFSHFMFFFKKKNWLPVDSLCSGYDIR